MKYKYPYKTAKIQYRDLKPHIRKGIKDYGLYFLEKIFGICRGHGAGVGGEDISFDLPKIKRIIAITDNGRRLEIFEEDELYNQRGEWNDIEGVNIRPATLKHLKYRLCK